MQNTRASLKKYNLAKFFVADLNPTENVCFSRCKKWSKTSKMYETNYSDERSFNSMVSAQFHGFDFSNCYLVL